MSIFAWGSNKRGELGITSCDDDSNSTVPTISPEPRILSTFESLTALAVAAGESHSLVVGENGDLYSFGRGREGQLGLGCEKADMATPQRVSFLQNEYIVAVAAGAMNSFALTATGKVYQWGLIQRKTNDPSSQAEDATASGQLAGLAASQDTVVTVDVETRENRPIRRAPGRINVTAPRYRQLRDIVSESTERWLLANDDADSEYYEEMQAMGYNNEVLEERHQNRAHNEYHGMLRVGCHREPQSIPRLIPDIAHLHVKSISAGFAHCMILTSTGYLYASGYNDRGQLGLGHRVSTADFILVQHLEQKIVIQVSCGQQHTICRVLDRNLTNDPANDIEALIGSQVGADLYAWGNGILGQLGMGRKGTSKGRLLPNLIQELVYYHPQGIIDISCGENFSVAVSNTGMIWSWGHAEYNQHGTGNTAGGDYVDPYFFFIPRKLDINTRITGPVVKVSCGSNFTIGITATGRAYSWGWGAYGALGRGTGHFSCEPSIISSIGPSCTGTKVIAVATGANHVLSIVLSTSSSWAQWNKCLLDSSDYADAVIEIEGLPQLYYCHRIILSARSSYFKGYLNAAAQDPSSVALYAVKQTDLSESQQIPMTKITLSNSTANPLTVRALLEYIYTDRFNIPAHKGKQLQLLAQDLSLDRLAEIASQARYKVCNISPSVYADDMGRVVGCEDFADVIFYCTQNNGSDGMESKGEQKASFCGHRCLLARMDYFRSLFGGNFKENMVFNDALESKKTHLNIDGFIADGVDFCSFQKAIYFTYTGSIDNTLEWTPADCEDESSFMSLYVAGCRLGLSTLTHKCENLLYNHLSDYPGNAESCLGFAEMYDIPRLAQMCQEFSSRVTTV